MGVSWEDRILVEWGVRINYFRGGAVLDTDKVQCMASPSGRRL